tara:strand:+ start:661 stop:2058 length:1398 start_codon:yes stop_codon:yes gene_type:complete
MKACIAFLCVLLSMIASAQVELQQDSVLTFEEFMLQVRSHHPIARQADLIRDGGAATVRSSRGGFDPKLKGNLDQKYFDDQEYYDLGKAGISIPTWFGIELEGGYERNQGYFLNPENNVPNAGLWFAGLSIPLGQGLFIDERRADLRRAQAFQRQSNAERDLALNTLGLEAGEAYWQWFQAYHKLDVIREAVQIAEVRYNAVKRSAFLGDMASIDTLEASIQLQNRQLMLNEAELEFRNQTRALSFYFWLNGQIPLELSPAIRAQSMETMDVSEIGDLPPLDTILNRHPEIRSTRAKIEQLEVDRRLASEMLKPEINLRYKPLTEAVSGDIWSEYSVENYSWGVQFNFPLFLRKERGKLQLTKLKLQDGQYQLLNKRQSIGIKVQQAINTVEATQGQILLGSAAANNYRGLVEGEQQLFRNGESSLFLVNSRERSYINARVKVIELVAKNKSSDLKLQFAMGVLK